MLKVNKSFLFQRERTALHLAAEKGNLDAVEKLLEHGADINKKDKVFLCMCYLVVQGRAEIQLSATFDA